VGVNYDATEAMIIRIRNARFRTTRFRLGYSEREVDNYLDEVISRLELGQPPVPPTGFSVARLVPGYVLEDVDALLDEITGFSPGS
jgi:DivIVA domain-containing protein